MSQSSHSRFNYNFVNYSSYVRSVKYLLTQAKFLSLQCLLLLRVICFVHCSTLIDCYGYSATINQSISQSINQSFNFANIKQNFA